MDVCLLCFHQQVQNPKEKKKCLEYLAQTFPYSFLFIFIIWFQQQPKKKTKLRRDCLICKRPRENLHVENSFNLFIKNRRQQTHQVGRQKYTIKE